MKVTCSVCGKSCQLSKAHKDYQKIAKQHSSYICEKCSTWIQFQMQHSQDFRRAK
jgi:hypothetical protein